MKKLLDKLFFWFTEILTKFFKYIETKRQGRLSLEFKKYNLWNSLSNENDKFIFLDIGFMPNFDYRIEEYFQTTLYFTELTHLMKQKNIIKNKMKSLLIN